ncbi:MAG: hypothetical protein ACP5UN_00665 [Candidatus Micrarchaeia archaeon]
MDLKKIMGYALIIVGLIIIIFVFATGYSLYQNTISAVNFIQPSVGLNGSIGVKVNSTLASLNSIGPEFRYIGENGMYLFISVLLLFLFAGIGYKIAFIGVQMLKTETTYLTNKDRSNK